MIWKLCSWSCSWSVFQVDCSSTLLEIRVSNGNKICFLLMRVSLLLLLCLCHFPQKMNLLNFTRLLILSCFLYIDKGECPVVHCPGLLFTIYFIGFSGVVTRICSRPCSWCILAEYNLALNKFEGYLASKFTLELRASLSVQSTLGFATSLRHGVRGR